jgi:hypothetical protein
MLSTVERYDNMVYTGGARALSPVSTVTDGSEGQDRSPTHRRPGLTISEQRSVSRLFSRVVLNWQSERSAALVSPVSQRVAWTPMQRPT